MRDSIENIERLAKSIEVFSKPVRINVAAKKLNCTERSIYRIIESLKEDGFTFKKLAKGYRIKSVPESATVTVMDLGTKLLSM